MKKYISVMIMKCDDWQALYIEGEKKLYLTNREI